MFPTFSGNSRRPRNVNMSGQRNLNPFAGTPWTPTSSSSASRTVADAQAERSKRQYEREKLKAAQSIQRMWRGHKARKCLRDERREALDALYDHVSNPNLVARASQALPLVVTALDPRLPNDRTRLQRFAQDLVQSDYYLVKSDMTASTSQVKKLASQLLIFLQHSDHDQPPASIFGVIVELLRSRLAAMQDNLDNLYDIAGRYCRNETRDAESLSLLEQAIVVPISCETERHASTIFSLKFLTQPHLKLFEKNVAAFAEIVDIRKISAAIVEAYAAGWASSQHTEARLWLLAHFIALGGGNSHSPPDASYFHALYIQLSSLLAELKKYDIGQGPSPTVDSANLKNRPPPFIKGVLESLVERNEILSILERCTANFVGSSQEEHNEASLLAAYILTLTRCFPALSDEIRMRLYMADIPSHAGHPNSVKLFWDAMARTRIFLMIMSDDNNGNVLDILQRKNSKALLSIRDDAVWNREWRTIFLFLELYIFVLRLTDDEDFFSPFETAVLQSGVVSRLRQCMLTLDELKSLTMFLRNLAFTLYYNASDLHQHAARSKPRDPNMVEGLFGSRSKTLQKTAKAQDRYGVILGLDFDTFRSTITQAMRMVYERDSRRQFLPSDHWLMASRFDMESFRSEVVIESERQREFNDAGSDEDTKRGEDEDQDADKEEGGNGEDGENVGDDDSDGDGDQDAYLIAGSYSQVLRNLRLERLRAEHRKEQRKMQLDAVAPKLEILRNMPFVIPFDTRVKTFREFVYLDQMRRRYGHIEPDQWRMSLLDRVRDAGAVRDVLGRHHAKVRRGMVFEDAFEQFYELGSGLKEPIQITFVDQFDMAEAGIDGGGVTKEFLMSVTKEALTDDHSLFVANNSNALYPNPCAMDQRQQRLRESGLTAGSEEWKEAMSSLLEQYEFLGRVIGKCLYEGILIDVVFAGFFLLKWAAAASDAGYRANVNELRELDEELYANMMKLKNYAGDVSELGLDFTIDDQISMANEAVRIVTRNLAPNGDKMTVTNENKLLFINYVARHRLVAQPHMVTRAFLTGLGAIVEPAWLSMFNQSELQRLVGGDSTEIDVEDLRRNTVYSGIFEIGDDGEEHPVIAMFWDVMHDLEDSQRRDVLKYVTSTPRAPLLGFSQLRPPFSIRDGGQDTSRLPSASTCVNLLKLPLYAAAAQLRNKLTYAVSSGAGFDLS